ncbi:MAG: precorrin-6A reductase, partial [Oscillospiraceae bacterium]|nr:precorrin-6A reductase [Oscillospiraceae bacterium]
MYKLCVFAGTTEGRKLASFLGGQENVTATICVATDYGEQLISPSDNITVSSKRLTKDEMKEFFVNEGFCLVIDATHPYAAVVTENISSACAETGTEYIRLLRENSGVALCGDVFYASDTEAAAEFLAGTDGNILLTTGSKEIAKYSSIPGFADRVFARVLPMDSSLKACSDAGLKPANILAIQGPFSEEMNISMLRFTNAKYLVTKDGGSAGGFGEKMSACLRENVCAVIIGRPPQLEGLSFGETIRRLCSRFGLKRRPHVSVVGIGPGNKENMTVEVLKAVEQAQCLIGAERMLSAVASPSQMTIEAIAPSAIAKAIEDETEFFDFSVVMSGDSGFFSGTKKLLPLLSECEVSVLPGISSLSYLCSRTGESYEDVKLVSTHGRDHNIVADVRRNRRVFTLVGGENGAGKLCRTLCEAGLGEVTVCVGSKLS